MVYVSKKVSIAVKLLSLSVIFYPSVVFGESTSDLAQQVNDYYHIAVNIGFPLGVVIIIYAGYLYITSTGNPETIGQAKQLLVGAISGLLVLLLAGLILGSGGLIESRA